MALLGHYLWAHYFPGIVSGQPGKPGAQVGIGLLAVMAWWLGCIAREWDETDAAATPTKTTERAMMRIASFMVGNPFLIWNLQKRALLHASTLVVNDV
jgi:hypothetical protein